MTRYFYDLHVHSCLSPCADNDMTPNNIAGMAALKGLNLVALTDHNSCKNCPAFFEACRRQGIIPIAGMELSTAEDIHLVCLFPTLDAAMNFDGIVEKHLMNVKNRPEIFGDQIVTDENDEAIAIEDRLLISVTDLWIGDAVRLVREYGGYIRPAHIDRESNGIVAILGDIPSEYGFGCFEFNDPSNIEEYRKRFPYITDDRLLVCSDAHRLWEINEAEHFLMIDDEPYSSALVRERFFGYLGELDEFKKRIKT
ncbi:MAG: PHP domain-containing protein [Clostridia bacterium]|nr:PHP domain-containing protein [Clostridia bacterium]